MEGVNNINIFFSCFLLGPHLSWFTTVVKDDAITLFCSEAPKMTTRLYLTFRQHEWEKIIYLFLTFIVWSTYPLKCWLVTLCLASSITPWCVPVSNPKGRDTVVSGCGSWIQRERHIPVTERLQPESPEWWAGLSVSGRYLTSGFKPHLTDLKICAGI